MAETLIYEKSKFPSIENCTLCKHCLHIPDGDENEGDYCFEGSISNQLKDADFMDENCVKTYSCNHFEEKKG